jgi:hypothetical protein
MKRIALLVVILVALAAEGLYWFTARAHFRSALALARNPMERRFFLQRAVSRPQIRGITAG